MKSFLFDDLLFSAGRAVSLKTFFSTLTSHLPQFMSLPHSHQPLFPLVSLILLPDSMLSDSLAALFNLTVILF